MNIHVRRTGALGDVLLTTPIIRQLRQLNPNASIHFYTDCPQVYANNPRINSLFTAKSAPSHELIDLDMVYENNPTMHIIEAYERHTFGIPVPDKSTEIFVNDEQKAQVGSMIIANGITPETAVVVHMAKSWPSRTMAIEKWMKLIDRIIDKGFQVVIVGSGDDFDYRRPGTISLKGKLSIQHINYLCSLSYAFIGMDSGMYHVAGATPENTCKIFGLFTCAESKYRAPFRKNVFSVKANIECYGCLHRVAPPVTFIGCERKDNECVNRLKVEQVIEML